MMVCRPVVLVVGIVHHSTITKNLTVVEPFVFCLKNDQKMLFPFRFG